MKEGYFFVRRHLLSFQPPSTVAAPDGVLAAGGKVVCDRERPGGPGDADLGVDVVVGAGTCVDSARVRCRVRQGVPRGRADPIAESVSKANMVRVADEVGVAARSGTTAGCWARPVCDTRPSHGRCLSRSTT